MELYTLKDEARQLKLKIEAALAEFHNTTGETAIIEVMTRTEKTTVLTMVSQHVNVTIQL